MATQTEPAASWTSVFQGILTDVAKAKAIDIERGSDDNNIPGYADVRTGNGSQTGDTLGGVFTRQIGGLSVWQWGGLLAAGGLGVWLVTRLLK